MTQMTQGQAHRFGRHTASSKSTLLGESGGPDRMPMVGKGEAKGFHFTLGAVFGILMIVQRFNQICVLTNHNRSVDQRLQDYTPLNELEKACKDQMKKVFK